jgi:hypothetical protein
MTNVQGQKNLDHSVLDLLFFYLYFLNHVFVNLYLLHLCNVDLLFFNDVLNYYFITGLAISSKKYQNVFVNELGPIKTESKRV